MINFRNLIGVLFSCSALMPMASLAMQEPRSKEEIYRHAFNTGLSREMKPMGHPVEISQHIQLNNKSFALAGLNIQNEFIRGLTFAKVTIAGQLEAVENGKTLDPLETNTIRTLPISNAKRDVAEEYFFIKILRSALEKVRSLPAGENTSKQHYQEKLPRVSILSEIELEHLKAQFTSPEALNTISDYLKNLKNPYDKGNDKIIDTLIQFFDFENVSQSCQEAIIRWNKFQLKPRSQELLERTELVKKIEAFLPENFNGEVWQLWFNSREAIIQGIKRGLNLYQSKRKVPGVMAFQELTTTEFIDLKKAFPDYQFVGFDALKGQTIAEDLDYAPDNNKGPDGLGNLNAIMYSKDAFKVMDAQFSYLIPTDLQRREDQFQHKFNVACFTLQQHSSGKTIKLFNTHLPTNQDDQPLTWYPLINFINNHTENQTQSYALIMDGNTFPDAKGAEAYLLFNKKLYKARDWRDAEGLKYFSHPKIAQTTFIGRKHDRFKNSLMGDNFEPRVLDIRFLTPDLKVVAALNDGIPLKISNNKAMLLEGNYEEEEQAYLNHLTGPDHTLSVFVVQPDALEVAAFKKLEKAVSSRLKGRHADKDKWYYYSLEDLLEQIKCISLSLNSLRIKEIIEHTKEFRKDLREIEKDFSGLILPPNSQYYLPSNSYPPLFWAGNGSWYNNFTAGIGSGQLQAIGK